MPDFVARHRQVLVFLLVGGASAVLDVGLMQLLLIAGAPVLGATSVAFAAGLAFNFICHARYTFASAMSGPALLRYLSVVALNYLLTLACVSLAVALALHPVGGKVCALVIVPVINYFLGKHWIFK